MSKDSTLRPLQPVRMLEAGTPTQVSDALDKLLRSEVPGFIIRAANQRQDPLEVHQVISQELNNQVAARRPQMVTNLSAVLRGNPAFDQNDRDPDKRGRRVFHFDGSYADHPSLRYNTRDVAVHTTDKGAPTVILAEPGPAFPLLVRQAKHTSHGREQMYAQATDLLKKGMVDSDITSPDVHVAKATRGDTVVMGVQEGDMTKDVWHAFVSDNQAGPRTFHASEINSHQVIDKNDL
ncbi:MAG: hypothetical protein JWS12_878 [Candidatus Saccharibacteria bacterium]|nr:hypothetical protein [Candidatus Saccharibacteria bacterium]